MSYEWAKREVEIACKRENPDWDGESFDYGCSCYQSALKAYKSLCEDGHSGYSFGATRNILKQTENNIQNVFVHIGAMKNGSLKIKLQIVRVQRAENSFI